MIKSILGGKSKNLFDISKADVVIHSDMSFSSNVSYNSHFYSIPVEAGQTYTVSYDIYAIEGGGTQIALSCQTGDFYQDGVLLFSQLTPDNSINNWEHITNTFTIPSGATKITFSSLKYPEYPKYFRNFQLELGSTATEYVPHELTSYKSIMKVSDVCQLVDKNKIPTTRTISGVTFTNNGDGSVTVDGTSTHQYYSEIVIPIDGSLFIPGHVYLNGTIAGDFAGFVALYGPVAKDYLMAPQQIYTLPSGKDFNKFRYIIRVRAGMTANNYTSTPQLFDLTEMFGAGNEPKTVAEFKAKFPNDYYPYSPSCFVTSFDERMPCKTKNLFDKSKADVISREYYFTPNQPAGSNFYVMTVKPGITYTVTYERFVKSTDTDSHNALELSVQTGTHYKDGTQLLFRVGNGERGVWVKRSGQFTIPSDINQVTFSGLMDRFLYRNFMVQEGTTATDYVPYGYV